jgi:hypothetical protein
MLIALMERASAKALSHAVIGQIALSTRPPERRANANYVSDNRAG